MSPFRRLSLASVAATVMLVGIGGVVRATKSGLGCGTDWPECSGNLVPALETRAQVIEFSHRLGASVVGFLLLALVVMAVRHHRHTPKILWPTVAAFGLVVFQALLGMVVVKKELEAAFVVLHLSAALSLLALLIYVAVASEVAEGTRRVRVDRALSRRAAGMAAGVMAVLLLGSYVSGRGAGFVFPDWPLMNGTLVPDLSNDLYAIHFLHRAAAAIVGVVLFVFGIGLTRRRQENPAAARLAHAAMGLFGLQIFIGALNVWTELNAVAVSAHLLVGALIWAAVVGIGVVSLPTLEHVGASPSRAPAAVLEGGR